MSVRQLFETTVVDMDSAIEARFIVLPRRVLGQAHVLSPKDTSDEHQDARIEFLLASLALRPLWRVSLGDLSDWVAMSLAAATSPELSDRLFSEREVLDPEDYSHMNSFAEELTFAPIVPFEESPLALDSLATIIARASSAGLGAYLGFVVGGGSPLILITVPAGMILFGAAAGVARALQDGLYERILALIRGTAPAPRLSPPKARRRRSMTKEKAKPSVSDHELSKRRLEPSKG